MSTGAGTLDTSIIIIMYNLCYSDSHTHRNIRSPASSRRCPVPIRPMAVPSYYYRVSWMLTWRKSVGSFLWSVHGAQRECTIKRLAFKGSYMWECY